MMWERVTCRLGCLPSSMIFTVSPSSPRKLEGWGFSYVTSRACQLWTPLQTRSEKCKAFLINTNSRCIQHTHKTKFVKENLHKFKLGPDEFEWVLPSEAPASRRWAALVRSRASRRGVTRGSNSTACKDRSITLGSLAQTYFAGAKTFQRRSSGALFDSCCGLRRTCQGLISKEASGTRYPKDLLTER